MIGWVLRALDRLSPRGRRAVAVIVPPPHDPDTPFGVDTTSPEKRIASNATGFAFTVARGAHFACVRPQYPGAETDSQTLSALLSISRVRSG